MMMTRVAIFFLEDGAREEGKIFFSALVPVRVKKKQSSLKHL